MTRATAALLLGVAFLAGCAGSRLDREPWRAGTELVLLELEARPEGVVERRTHWRFEEVRGGYARFDRWRDGGGGNRGTEWLALRDGVPQGRLGIGARGRRYEADAPPRAVRIPAGVFPCTRTVRSVEAADGAMMRVDEWWTPGVPVPVQTWTRWQGVADSLPPAPRRRDDLRVGTSWQVLEAVRRP